MKFYYLIIFICITTICQAQIISGIVRDSLNSDPIPYASVKLLNAADSSFIVGGITSEQGQFSIEASKGNYILDVSYMGYKKYQCDIHLSSDKKKSNYGNIFLAPAHYTLDEAVILGYVPDIRVKGDTIEYNADSYKVTEDALLQDLIRRLPGIEISADGKLMANGKVITKILIDGKEFFDNDIDLALKNLPASMVNKLQIFKEESEQSKMTGFKDNNSQQVINLTVKDGLKQTLFGNIKSGYGTNDKYANKINAQYLVDDNQYAVIGNLNNISDDFEYAGLSGQYDGITKNKNIGFNFNTQKSKTLKVGGSLKLDNNKNLFEMKTETRTFLETGDRKSFQSSSSMSAKRDLRLGLNMNWTPDTLTTVYARIGISTGTSNEVRASLDKSYIIAQSDTTTGFSNYKTGGDTYNLTGMFMYGRKLNKKGRNISLSLNASTNGTNSNGINYSETVYGNINNRKIIDQTLNIDNTIKNWSFSTSFVEPIGKGQSIQLSYSYRSQHSQRERFTYRRNGEGEYTIIDTAYTRSSTSTGISQRFNVSYQSVKEKFEYTVGFNIDPSSSSNKSYIGDTIIENQRQTIVNYSPTIRLSYKPKKNISLDFDYYGTTEQPSLKQLSSDTVILSALSKVYGNPNLKPSYQNNINIYLQNSNLEKGSFISISAGGNYTLNKIVDYSMIDEVGNTENTYVNVNGNWGINGGLTFSTPLRNRKITIDNSSYGYLIQNIGFSNGLKSITKNLTMSESFSISYKTNKLTQRLQANLSYNITRNSLPNRDNLNITNYGLKSSTNLKLPYNFSLQNEISYTYNKGYTDNFKNSELLWNFALSKQFLKKKQLTAKIQCYDIFDDRNNQMRVTAGNYISDTQTNMVGRYFLFSFNYRFNIIPKGSSATSDDNEASFL